VEEFALSVGASIGYYQGDPRKITDDVAAMRPSLFIAVPRVLERIQSGIQVRFGMGLAWFWHAFVVLMPRGAFSSACGEAASFESDAALDWPTFPSPSQFCRMFCLWSACSRGA
jgi:hypothetical protein